MFSYLFTFRSLTAAQSAGSILHRAAVACQVQRAPAQASAQGCGYAVRVPGTEGRRAASVLRMWQRPFGKSYRLSDGGRLEETAL